MTTQQLRPPVATLSGPDPSRDEDVVVSGPRGSVHVSHGVYSHGHPLAGMTVRQARAALAERMNIAPDATALVNGQESGDDTVLTEGVSLMFVREAGEKGVECEVVLTSDALSDARADEPRAVRPRTSSRIASRKSGA